MNDARLDSLLQRLEAIAALVPAPEQPDWSGSCFRWERQQALGISFGALKPIALQSKIALSDLRHVDEQKKLIVDNTLQFLAGLPCNNVLLTGSRGTGKSSLIKACLHQYAKKGLRLIEVDKEDLADLAKIVELVSKRSERFIFL